MFSSLHARMMRTAISPRLATRIFSNMQIGRQQPGPWRMGAESPLIWPQFEQRLAEFHRFGIFDHDLGNDALGLSFDFVHDLHGFDNADNRFRVNFSPNFDVRGGFR